MEISAAEFKALLETKGIAKLEGLDNAHHGFLVVLNDGTCIDVEPVKIGTRAELLFMVFDPSAIKP